MNNATLKPLGLPGQDDEFDAYVKARGLPVLASVPAPHEQVVAVVPPVQPRTAPLSKMSIEVPDYLPTQLRRLALEGDCTIRHFILEALHKAGCDIAEEDRRKDGRRSFRQP